MDDAIYILIAILWIAYSFYSAYQKAQKQKQKKREISENPDTETVPEPYIPERDILKELLGEPLPPEAPEPVTPPLPKPRYVPLTPPVEAVSMEEIIDEVNEPQRRLTRVPDTEPIPEPEPSFAQEEVFTDAGFNLRKAVIYSEIINRKYV